MVLILNAIYHLGRSFIQNEQVNFYSTAVTPWLLLCIFKKIGTNY